MGNPTVEGEGALNGQADMQQIRERARAIVAENPGGIKVGALLDRISEESPETPKNTIGGATFNLDAIYPSEISKPSRGLFKPTNAGGDDSVVVGNTEQTAPTGAKVRESEFYEPFAEWLKTTSTRLPMLHLSGAPA
jgi:hypothetical protein